MNQGATNTIFDHFDQVFDQMIKPQGTVMKKGKPIPISAAKEIAKKYGYEQIIILGRHPADGDDNGMEHLTTYGINELHCGIARRIGTFLKRKIINWE